MPAVKSLSLKWPSLPRRLANLLSILLVLNLAISLARVTWDLLWTQTPPVTLEKTSGTTPAAGADTRALFTYPMFGEPGAGTPVAESVKRSAPETRLRLKLEGVLVGAQPEDSGAIVSGSNGDTQYYRIGDILPGDAELMEVEPGRIILRRGGEYESLNFDEEGAALATQQEAEPEETGERSPEDYIAGIQQELQEQGAAALAKYGLKPGPDGRGYVFDGSYPMFRAAGLKPGDTIFAINGQSLGDVEQDAAMIEEWRNAQQLQIDIQRDSSQLTVTYTLPQ